MSPDIFKEKNVIKIAANYPELRVEKPNIYLIRKSFGYVMIDCGGFDTEKDFEGLCNELHTRNIRAQEIKYIFLTHTHKDHSLLCGRLQKLAGSTVLVGKEDILRISDSSSEYRERYQKVTDYLSFWGFDNDMKERFFRSFERQYHNAALDPKKTILAEKDTEIESFRVIFSPGHTAGSVCIFDNETGILFTGDTLLKKIVSVPVIEYDIDAPKGLSLLTRHTDTLRRLSEIGYEYIFPGHGEPVINTTPVISTIFSYIARRSKRILSLIHEGRKTVYSIAEALYSKDTLKDVVYREGPLVYVSDLMMPLENLLKENRITVTNGIISAE